MIACRTTLVPIHEFLEREHDAVLRKHLVIARMAMATLDTILENPRQIILREDDPVPIGVLLFLDGVVGGILDEIRKIREAQAQDRARMYGGW